MILAHLHTHLIGGTVLILSLPTSFHTLTGDSDEVHPCIGNARRMMVSHRNQQADILVQAVQNHTPDVIIVDEIGTAQVGLR